MTFHIAMNWILRNKEWLFSGVGVTAVLLLAGFLNRAFSRRTTPGATQMPDSLRAANFEPLPTTFTKPTPIEIEKQIRSVPPFQQEQSARAYEGLTVYWPMTFRDLYTVREGQWTILLEYPFGGIIVCDDVDLKAYPKFKFIHAGENLRVRGTIERVEGVRVLLRDASFEFD